MSQNLYCTTYSKEIFQVELYLLLDIPRRLRNCLARFRTSSTNLEIEKGRHLGIAREDRLCRHCSERNIIKN